MDYLKQNWFRVGLLLAALIIVFLYLEFPQNQDRSVTSKNDDFQKKQDCAQYQQLVKQKIEDSGRLFANDTYEVMEIFYSPGMNTCLYAWRLDTTFEPTPIYSIDDIFGGGIFTVGISENSSELFYAEINKLKQ